MWEVKLMGLVLLVIGLIGMYAIWIVRWKPKFLEEKHHASIALIEFLLSLCCMNDRFSIGLIFFVMALFGGALLVWG
ncbi:hypothetical protein [Marininema halotolerans]|uniref:Uncharacterized protein n=1 Tax=Marininema halotolerans TaxID=1155944 RepID=A0A1I6RGW8_9BACL|nr:hypothetical protein [Marininema halotolerans]SFS63957.1 hypothetical protein SAMN05444972_10584 [Marininema halotolerans]